MAHCIVSIQVKWTSQLGNKTLVQLSLACQPWHSESYPTVVYCSIRWVCEKQSNSKRGCGVNPGAVVIRPGIHRLLLHHSRMTASQIIIHTWYVAMYSSAVWRAVPANRNRFVQFTLSLLWNTVPMQTLYITEQMTHDALTHIWYIRDSWHNLDWLDECRVEWLTADVRFAGSVCLSVWTAVSANAGLLCQESRRVIRISESLWSVIPGAGYNTAIQHNSIHAVVFGLRDLFDQFLHHIFKFTS